MDSIQELLVDQMRDLYDAEKQLVKALPKMVKAASSPTLKEAFEGHLEKTRGHVERLERAFETLGEKAKSKPCDAMKGLIEEGEETAGEDFSENLLDSAIICAAQKVEHYEIAGYGTLSSWARSKGLDEVAELFDETLSEEKEADETLTRIADQILSDVEAVGTSEEEESELVRGDGRRKGAARKPAVAHASKRRAG